MNVTHCLALNLQNCVDEKLEYTAPGVDDRLLSTLDSRRYSG